MSAVDRRECGIELIVSYDEWFIFTSKHRPLLLSRVVLQMLRKNHTIIAWSILFSNKDNRLIAVCPSRNHPVSLTNHQIYSVLFTAHQVPKGQSPSKLFTNYGATNLAPGPVSNARIAAYPKSENGQKASTAWSYAIGSHISRFCGITKDETSYPAQYSSSFAKTQEDADRLFSTPIAVTTVKATETVTHKMQDVGFTKTAVGRFSFFEGVASPTSIMKVVALSGEMFSHAPQEKTSLGGAMSCFIIRRLLYNAFCISPRITTPSANHRNEPYESVIPPRLLGSSLEGVTEGHFMPYFHGLLLPDKNIIHIFINIFGKCLGKDEKARQSTLTILHRGWSTFHNTSSGRVASHMIYALNVAIQGGFDIIPIIKAGEYVGCVLSGDSAAYYNSNIVQPDTVGELKKQVSSMTSHSNALEDILNILRPLQLYKTEVTRDIESTKVDTSRKLHYAITDRKLNPEIIALIEPLIKKLRFTEVHFKVVDEGHLLTTIEAIANKSRLDPMAPFDLSVGATFTSSLVLSTLAAYGQIAPSFINSAAPNSVVSIKEGFLKGTTQGALRGIPVFGRPLQQAVEDWKTVKKTGALTFRTKGQDATGHMKVADIARFVEQNDDEGRQIYKLLLQYGKKGLKKRARDDEDDSFTGVSKTEAEAESSQRSQKKRKTEEDNIFQSFGWDDPEPTAMDEDVE